MEKLSLFYIVQTLLFLRLIHFY